MKRILLLWSVLFLFYSCSSKLDYSDKKIFKYNESAGITSLDPAFAKDQANIWAVNQLFNGLVQFDSALNIKPCIAKSWLISDSGKVYTFYLRKDVYFHKNECFSNKDSTRKVVASDFVYSFNRLLNEKVASPGVWVFNNVEKNGFKALNDTTFQIVLKGSFPPFMGLLCMKYCSVVPKEAIENQENNFARNPVGTGAFCFKMWKEGVKMVLLKNKNYFEYDGANRLPYLDAVNISFVIDKQTAFLEFIKGNLDFISGIDASYKDELLTPQGLLNPKYSNKVYLIKQAYLNTEYLGFLMDDSLDIVKSSPLKDKRIRQAINFGFDRVKMMAYLRNNIGKAAVNGMIPRGMPSFDENKMYGYSYKPDKSRALLEEAGYPGGVGLPEIKLSTTASYLDICNYIQHELSQVGIKLIVDVTPPGSLREMIATSKMNFFRGSWIADYADAENYLSLFCTNNFCPKGPNYTHFSSKEFDKLYELSFSEVNDSLRYTYYQKMDSIIMSEAAVVPLYYDEVLRFIRKNIKGLGSNPMNLLDLKKVMKD
ncbi:MAG: ABC transporter substrate-binding protein [Bacteroidota bacterium]